MTNHVHLLVTPKAAEDIPRLVIAIGRRHVQTINKTYRRTSTLWVSRYKSSLIHTDPYLLRCHRYIELNPVRADMVAIQGIQQSQPIGSERFLQQIEQMTGQRREAGPRGRPRLEPDGPAVLPEQMELEL